MRRLRGLAAISSRRADPLAGAAVALITLAGVAMIMRLWKADFGVPFLYGGDSSLFLLFTKSVLQHGWLYVNPDLGAPFGQQVYDFPVSSGDTIHILELKLLGLFSSNPATVVNVFVLIGFPLTAISAFATFRVLAVSRLPAAVCAVLFAVLPFHFFENVAQPFHSAYWVVPPACYLVLSILAGRPLFARADHPRHRLLAYASRRTLLTLLLCLVIGSAGSNYYALYAAILVAAVTPFALLRTRRLRTFFSGALVAVAIVGAVFVNALPTIVYHAENGTNHSVGQRQAQESELYSLSIAPLVLPIQDHRLSPLAHLRDRYQENSPLPGVAQGPGLGIVASIGFLWLLGFALASCVGAVRRSSAWSMHGDAALSTVASFLIATTGGFSIIFALLISPQLRVWERFNIFIGFFSLLAVALLLERAVARIGTRGVRRYAAVALLAGVLVIGALDQTSNRNVFFAPPFAKYAAEYHMDGDFVKRIERRMPPAAEIFELPYVPFPDGLPVNRTYTFDQVRGYLQSSDLRWSYGAMQGRPADWSAALADKPVELVLPAVAAAGFDGIWIDRFAYNDDARALERQIGEILRERPITSSDGRLSFFDLRSYRRSLAHMHTPPQLADLRAATLYPLRPEAGPGLTPLTAPSGAFVSRFQLTGHTGELRIENPATRTRRVTLQLRLSPAVRPAVVRVTTPSGPAVLRGADPLRIVLRLPPGSSAIRFAVARAPASLPVSFDSQLTQAAFAAFARPGPNQPSQPVPGRIATTFGFGTRVP
jgi:phosphoglycerol transferase